MSELGKFKNGDSMRFLQQLQSFQEEDQFDNPEESPRQPDIFTEKPPDIRDIYTENEKERFSETFYKLILKNC